MSEANKAVVIKFLNTLGGGDVETLKTVMTDDIVANTTGTWAFSGAHHYKELVKICASIRKVSKLGINFKILNLTAEDDRVACEMEGYCTLRNGQEYNNWYHFLFFVRDGKVYKMNEYFDTKLADAVLFPAMAGNGG